MCIRDRTRIGVTGHRRYRQNSATDEAIGVVIARATEDGAPATIVSSLAEGADRAVAERVLDLPGSTLEVILPMGAAEYAADFESDDSRAQFAGLLARATSIDIVDTTDHRQANYERAGHAVVDRCDVLIAVWDGTPSRGRGGTADIITYALERSVRVDIVLVDRDD